MRLIAQAKYSISYVSCESGDIFIPRRISLSTSAMPKLYIGRFAGFSRAMRVIDDDGDAPHATGRHWLRHSTPTRPFS